MASGYKSNQIDLDQIFQPRGSATPVANTGYTVAGVDLSQRYAPRNTTPVPPTGFKTAGVDLNQIFNNISGAASVVGAFLVYPSASLATSLANTLPWKIAGTLYTSYPAGLVFPSGSVVEVTCPVDTVPASTTVIFGLVAVDGSNTPISPALQPLTWTSGDSDVSYLDVATVTTALPDSGPPYYAGSQYTTEIDTSNVKTYTALTQEGHPTAVTASIDIRTPGYQYTFIDYSPSGQTISSGLQVFPVWGSSSYPIVPTLTSEVLGESESTYIHGTTTFPTTGSSVTVTYTWHTTPPGALSSVVYTSLGQVLDTAPNIHFPTGTDIFTGNEVTTPSSGPVVTLSGHFQVTSYNSSTDIPLGTVGETVITVVDANNATVQFYSIKSATETGVSVTGPYSKTGQFIATTFALYRTTTSLGQTSLQLGAGSVVMNRKRVLVS
jgi:hypothetical protein